MIKKIIYGMLVSYMGLFSFLTPLAVADETTIVLTATDRKADPSGQSDATLLMAYDETTGHIALTSVPQSLVIPILGHAEGTLTEAYSLGEGALVADSLATWTGISIDHYLTLDMAGVEQLIDEVGGITVSSLESFNQDGYQFKQDEAVTMDGAQALAYMRPLTQEGSSITKQDRQVQVLQALGEKLSQEDLSAFGYIKMYQTYAGYIDSSLGKMEMVNLAKELMKSGRGVSYYELPKDATADQLATFLQP